MVWGVKSGLLAATHTNNRRRQRDNRKKLARGLNHRVEKWKEQEKQQTESNAQERRATLLNPSPM